MPDYIYLLENRLSREQQHALKQLRDIAREAGQILFLTGTAVRDLTSGYAVRELEVALQGNALKLKKQLLKHGAEIWGEDETSRTLYLVFPGTVRVDLVSTVKIEYPKPGKPVFTPGSIHDFLRCRDFSANSMALSLNEGSFGLLMDPLNGVADIEARTLRLVSPYGFIEDPGLMIRATRYKTRLGWEFDDRTRTRFENALEEGLVDSISAARRGEEIEALLHEEDGLRILRAYDSAGWMKVLYPGWTPAKADEAKLNNLLDLAVRLEMQGVHADFSAAQAQLLTAKLTPRDIGQIKRSFPRPGFAEEWGKLDQIAAAFQKLLLAKENQTPSVMYKLFKSHDPEAILWLGFTAREASVKNRFEKFLTEWPTVRQTIPHATLQEMRITPEIPVYAEVVEKLFLELIDGKLTSPEELKAFLEPFSPPAPPPPVSYKKARVKKARIKDIDDEDEVVPLRDDDEDDIDDLDTEGLDLPGVEIEADDSDDDDLDDSDDDLDEEDDAPRKPAKGGKKPAPPAKPAPKPAAKPEVKPSPKDAPKAVPPVVKPAPVVTKPAPKKPETKPVPAAKKPEVKPAAKPASKVVAKPAPKPPAKKEAPKPAAKKHTPAQVAKKPAAKVVAPAKKPVPKVVAKPAAKKPAPKPPAKPVKKATPAKGKKR